MCVRERDTVLACQTCYYMQDEDEESECINITNEALKEVGEELVAQSPPPQPPQPLPLPPPPQQGEGNDLKGEEAVKGRGQAEHQTHR